MASWLLVCSSSILDRPTLCGLAEPEAFVHPGPQAHVGRALASQATQGRVGRFLAGVADRAPAVLHGLGQPDLLEVTGGQPARLPGHDFGRRAAGVVICHSLTRRPRQSAPPHRTGHDEPQPRRVMAA